MSELVTTELIDGLLLMTINRPEARNAINFETAQALATALDRLDEDDAIILGILTGAGNTFSAGMDLKAFAATGQRPLIAGRGLGGLTERPPKKPLIAAVEGYALAGGFELALACDLIVAANNAQFGLPETRRGLVPSAGGMLRLPHRLPYHVALEVILTGEMLNATRAQQFGLVNRLAEPGQALAAALALGRTIAQNGPLAIQAAKQIIHLSRDWPQEHMFTLQRPYVDKVFASQDAKEGAAAFTQKRPPVWQGK